MAASMVTSPPRLVGALGDSRGAGQQALFVLQPPEPGTGTAGSRADWACLAGALPSQAAATPEQKLLATSFNLDTACSRRGQGVKHPPRWR